MFLSVLAASLFTTASLAREIRPLHPVGVAVVSRDEDLLEKYRGQVTRLHDAISNATQCYTDFIDNLHKAEPDTLHTINACGDKNEAARAELAATHEIARSPAFPSDKLFSAQLPDVLDSRTSLQGPWTKDLQDRVHQLTLESLNAVEASKRAALLPEYRKHVTALYDHLSKAVTCYEAYDNNVQKPGANPDSIDACDTEYDAVALSLRDARSTAYQPDFPDGNWLFEAKIPDMRDSRNQKKLDELRDAAKHAFEIKDQAKLVENYHEEVTDLQRRLASATKCYVDYIDHIHREDITDEGYKSRADQACNEAYRQIQAKLTEVRAAASKPNFPGASWLFNAHLPDITDGRAELQSEWTKNLEGKLRELTQAADRADRAGIQADDKLTQFNATVLQEVVPLVNKTAMETAEVLVKYVALNLLTQGKTAEDVKDAANKALLGFVKGLGHDMVDGVLKDSNGRNDAADDSDEYILFGAEDLVPLKEHDGNGHWAVQRWTKNTGEIHWRSISKHNVTTLYGTNNESRVVDPEDPGSSKPTRIFSWLITESFDDKGNIISYGYVSEDSIGVDLSQPCEHNRTETARYAARYLKRVKYGNRQSRFAQPIPADTNWMFENPWLCRNDPFSVYRAGFEVRHYRLCQRVLIFHHFPGEVDIGVNCLVSSTDFECRSTRGVPSDIKLGNPTASFISSVHQSGYIRTGDLAYSFGKLPTGLGSDKYQWVDLDGEGIAGVLTEQGNPWFYKRNFGDAELGPLETVAQKPSSIPLNGKSQLLDLGGNGQLSLVDFSGVTPGFFKKIANEDWSSFTPFKFLPYTRWDDPTLLVIDLTGDGHADIIMSNDRNNLGAETRIQYASSTKFYLQDRAARTPWVTNLPFPVHVVESVENHHGFFDTFEREFRGFGMVEQYNTEEFDISLGGSVSVPARDNTTTSIDLASHVPPVLTKTWYHTGAFLERRTMAGRFQQEYYKEPELSEEQTAAMLLAEVEEVPTSIRLTASNRVPFSATNLEARESCRVLKGTVLRVELYALDAKTGDNGIVQTGNPYSVSAHDYSVEILQPQGTNRHGVFMVHPREVIDFHYERTMYSVSGIPSPTADPRVTHEFALEVNEFGVPTKSAEVYYGRHHKDPSPLLTDDEKEKQRKLSITYKEKDFSNAILGQDTNRTLISCEARTYKRYNIAPESKINHITNLFSFEEIREKIATAEDGNHDLPFEDFDGTGATDPSQKKATETGQWVPAGEVFYSPNSGDSPAAEMAFAQQHFFNIHRFLSPFHRDNFNTDTTVTYDKYDLLVEQTKDPFGNLIAVGERDTDPTKPLLRHGQNYRLLQPWMVMDHNRNRSAVAYDVLRMVVGTATMREPEEDLGDNLDNFVNALDDSVILAYFNNPLAIGNDLLRNASSRFMYDVFAFFRTKDQEQPQPAAASNLTRETYVSDLQPGRRTGILYSFSYSDGFGREIQENLHAEAGPAPQRDSTSGKIIVGMDGPPLMSTDPVDPRWVGSGWKLYNNKGKPVREYEPFFTDTHHFEYDVRIGVSPLTFYDPLDRVVGTLFSNHTWSKVVFHPWGFENWDQNDTAAEPDPKDDPQLGDFFRRLDENEYLPTWYQRRVQGALGPHEDKAASKTEVHSNTPPLSFLDPMGRSLYSVDHNRFKYSDAADSDPINEEFAISRTVLDVQGYHRKAIDERNRIVAIYEYDLLGNVIHSQSMEMGGRSKIQNVGEKNVYTWDSRGQRFRALYDRLERQTDMFVRTPNGPEALVGRTIYGEGASFEAQNARGRVVRIGLEYNAKVQRTVIRYGNGVESSSTYGPYTFRLANLVTKRKATDFPDDNPQPPPAGSPGSYVQNLSYVYDPMTNITHANDAAQQLIYFRGRRVEPSNDLTYDSRYRLIDASGREHLGQSSNGQPNPPSPSSASDTSQTRLDHPGNGAAMGTYLERYAYDLVSNIKSVRHSGSDPRHPGWTRTFNYDFQSQLQNGVVNNNQLSSTAVGSTTENYAYDVHGCMTSMPHLSGIGWNYKDQLHFTSRQVVNNGGVPETTYYAYNACGQRVRKVTERQAAQGQAPKKLKERIYLGAFEIYRDYEADGTSIALERHTLHVMNMSQRVALAETHVRGQESGGVPEQGIQYQFANHIGSATLELDHLARIISYKEYTPYGSTSYQAMASQTETPPKRYRFTGKERDDESGLSYHGMEYYAPWLCRWTSCDPGGFVDVHNVDLDGMQTLDPGTADDPVYMGCYAGECYLNIRRSHIRAIRLRQSLDTLGVIASNPLSTLFWGIEKMHTDDPDRLQAAANRGALAWSVVGALSGTYNARNQMRNVGPVEPNRPVAAIHAEERPTGPAPKPSPAPKSAGGNATPPPTPPQKPVYGPRLLRRQGAHRRHP
ncbi:hypothetical protein MHUMG1_09578 [Metarhizium humberi]|uniref:Uncharacterized protein n=1 Tax=Metarhizium humberi TaxID=2596975 RepID=A0A9P8S368_9HYPO|nr:hypothetical protein MHUMG1_09578 [Metarhizium humberi]